jgi:hypothetical protein
VGVQIVRRSLPHERGDLSHYHAEINTYGHGPAFPSVGRVSDHFYAVGQNATGTTP